MPLTSGMAAGSGVWRAEHWLSRNAKMTKKVYDAHLNRPTAEWAEPIEIGYHVRYGDTVKIAEAVEKAAQKNLPLVLDWEADDALERLDPFRSSQSVVDTAIGHAQWIFNRAQAENPSVSVLGMYAAGSPTPTQYNYIRLSPVAWADGLWALNGLYDFLPTLYPVLYMPSTWRTEAWWGNNGREHTRQIAATVVAAGRARQKRVIPFVWPDAWESAAHAAEYVGDVLSESDGVIIWGSPTEYADAASDESRWGMIGDAVAAVMGNDT